MSSTDNSRFSNALVGKITQTFLHHRMIKLQNKCNLFNVAQTVMLVNADTHAIDIYIKIVIHTLKVLRLYLNNDCLIYTFTIDTCISIYPICLKAESVVQFILY